MNEIYRYLESAHLSMLACPQGYCVQQGGVILPGKICHLVQHWYAPMNDIARCPGRVDAHIKVVCGNHNSPITYEMLINVFRMLSHIQVIHPP